MEFVNFMNFNFTGKYNKWDKLPRAAQKEITYPAYRLLVDLAEYVESQSVEYLEVYFGRLMGEIVPKVKKDGTVNENWFIDQLNQYRETIVEWLIELPTQYFIDLAERFKASNNKLTPKMENLVVVAREIQGREFFWDRVQYNFKNNK